MRVGWFIKAALLVTAVLGLAACDTLVEVGIGGDCKHIATAEPVKQVKDEKGTLWEVGRHDNVMAASMGLDADDLCVVSGEIDVFPRRGWNSAYVLHGETGELIEVSGLQKGLRILDVTEYAWY